MQHYTVLAYLSSYVLDDPFDEKVVGTTVVSSLLIDFEMYVTVGDFCVSL